jgi:exonuclease VII large subunit
VRLADPALTLARGWSITRTSDGRTARDATDLRAGDTIVTQLAAGTVSSTVTSTGRSTADGADQLIDPDRPAPRGSTPP